MDIAQTSDIDWVLVLKWSSKRYELFVSKSMLKSDETNLFKMIIDTASVKKKLYPLYIF